MTTTRQEQIKTLMEAIENGFTYKEASELSGIPLGSIYGIRQRYEGRVKMTTTRQEQIKTLMEAIENGFTYKEASELSGIPVGSIGYIKKRYEVQKVKEAARKSIESKNKVKVSSNVITVNTTTNKVSTKSSVATIQPSTNLKNVENVVTINRNKKLEVAMIADRHTMPVNDFAIFDRVDPKDLFRFNWMDSKVSEFILNNINFVDFGGYKYPDTDLIVYVTGLSQALSSVIKMCSLYGVNLTLMHHSKVTEDYYAQSIFNNKSPLENLLSIFPESFGSIIVHGNLDIIKTDSKIVTLTETIYSNKVKQSVVTHIFMSEKDAFEENIKMQVKMSNMSNYVMLQMEKGYIKNNSYMTEKILLKSCNQ